MTSKIMYNYIVIIYKNANKMFQGKILFEIDNTI